MIYRAINDNRSEICYRKTDEKGEFCLSAYGTWIDGVYDTYRAANYAYRFTPTEISDLWKRKLEEEGIKALITFEDLQEVRKKRVK